MFNTINISVPYLGGFIIDVSGETAVFLFYLEDGGSSFPLYICSYPQNYTASRPRMSLSWRMDLWDPQILPNKFITGFTNFSCSSVLQTVQDVSETEFGFVSRFTDAEVSSGEIESRW
jgi:hypothetical protein